jgi:hypothetical protein
MNTPLSDGWTRCPPGSFRRLAAELTARRQRRLWFTRLAWAAGAAIALAGGWEATSAVTGWTIGEPSSVAPAEHCAPVPSHPVTPTNGK